MGRTSFVAWLFIMSIACVVIAIGDRSLGWFVGGVVLSAVAFYARKKLREEASTGPGETSFSFVGVAILLMLVAMMFIFWLQFKA